MRVHAVVCGAGRGGAGAGGVRGEGLCLVCHVRRRIHESACGCVRVCDRSTIWRTLLTGYISSSSYDMYPLPHMTCMHPPPHMTCMYERSTALSTTLTKSRVSSVRGRVRGRVRALPQRCLAHYVD